MGQVELVHSSAVAPSHDSDFILTKNPCEGLGSIAPRTDATPVPLENFHDKIRPFTTFLDSRQEPRGDRSLFTRSGQAPLELYSAKELRRGPEATCLHAEESAQSSESQAKRGKLARAPWDQWPRVSFVQGAQQRGGPAHMAEKGLVGLGAAPLRIRGIKAAPRKVARTHIPSITQRAF